MEDGLGPACHGGGAVEDLADSLLQGNGVPSAAIRTTAAHTILSRMVPDTAERLGSMWDEDKCSFFDVTVALNALCHLVHEITILERGKSDLSNGHSIMLTTVTKNQHMLGLLLVEAAFIRSGWDVSSFHAVDEMFRTLRTTWFSAVGLSVACNSDAGTIADLISAFRTTSLNPTIVVLVGGAYFKSDPEAAVRLGADATADDASLAVAACGRLVSERHFLYRQNTAAFSQNIDGFRNAAVNPSSMY